MVSYKKLKVLLAEKEISGVEFRKMVNISQSTFTKLNKNEFVSMEVIDRICEKLECDISDVVEYVRQSN